MEENVLSNCALIFLLNLIFYFKTLRFDYVSDDIPSAQRTPLKNPFLHYFWVLEGKLKSVSYKSMKDGVGFPFFLMPQLDHLITLILHSLVCVGIYVGFGSSNISFLAALLFSVNPINNQGSVWISGRGYVLASLGMVWALAVPWEMGWIPLLVASYPNAGFFMPIALVGSNHSQVLIFVPLIWMIWVKNFAKNVKQKYGMEAFAEDKKIEWFKLILATKTFGFYLIHSLLPIKNTFYHSFLESLAGSKKYRARTLCRFFWIGLVSIALMAWYMLTHKWDIVCFGILWWCVGIGPFLNLMRMQQEISERYCYLPNIGLMVALSKFLLMLDPVVSAAFFMMYATKTWFYMDTFKSDYFLVEHATLNSPDSWFCWNARANHRWQTKSFQEAIYFWQTALSLSPKEFKLLYNLGCCQLLNGNIPHAKGFFDLARQNIPEGQEKACGEILKGVEESINNMIEQNKANPGKPINVAFKILV